MSSKLNLTRRQANVLEFIRGYIRDHSYSPTLEEIGEELGVNRVTIFEHVKALENKNWIRTRKHCSRSIELVPEDENASAIPILGRIAAGQPIDAIEDRELFEVGDFFPTDRDCYMLRVNGNSMIDDQIRDGDFVLVESRPTAHPGETVVALIDDEEATLKRFYPQGDHIRLEPRNPELEPITVKAGSVTVQGVVIGVLRRYD
jgi:repressor LexA